MNRYVIELNVEDEVEARGYFGVIGDYLDPAHGARLIKVTTLDDTTEDARKTVLRKVIAAHNMGEDG